MHSSFANPKPCQMRISKSGLSLVLFRRRSIGILRANLSGFSNKNSFFTLILFSLILGIRIKSCFGLPDLLQEHKEAKIRIGERRWLDGKEAMRARLTNRVNRRCRSGAEGSDVASQRQRPG